MNFKRWITFLVLMLVLKATAQHTNEREFQVKAAFVYKFTQFIEWPSSSFEDASAPFVIGILGKDPFGSFIDKIIAGEKVNGRRIVVHRYGNVGEVGHCHILYINLVETEAMKEFLSVIKPGVLTVSDAPGFNQWGGMIWLKTKFNKINLTINRSAARSASLGISSKLLNVAEIFVRSRT